MVDGRGDMMPNDEQRLSQTERLALAWYRLSGYEWDPYIGPKPEGFDGLPDYLPPRYFSSRRPLCKSYYVRPVMTAIEETIGDLPLTKIAYDQSMQFHGHSSEDFIQWYFSIARLMEVRRELFPKPCRPTLLWRLRQRVRRWKSQW